MSDKRRIYEVRYGTMRVYEVLRETPSFFMVRPLTTTGVRARIRKDDNPCFSRKDAIEAYRAQCRRDAENWRQDAARALAAANDAVFSLVAAKQSHIAADTLEPEWLEGVEHE